MAYQTHKQINADSAIEESPVKAALIPPNLKSAKNLTIKTKSSGPVPGSALPSAVQCKMPLNQDAAYAAVRKLSEKIDQAYFEMGHVLSHIRKNKWFGEHQNLKELVESEFGMRYRKAAYFIEIYESIVRLGLSIPELETIGWTKMRRIVKVLTTENAAYWVEQAKKCSVTELDVLIKDESAQCGTSLSSISQAPHRKMFKFHDEQYEVITGAIERAKQQSGTDVDSLALEHICNAFLAGASVAEWIKFLPPAKVPEVLPIAFEKLSDESLISVLNELLKIRGLFVSSMNDLPCDLG